MHIAHIAYYQLYLRYRLTKIETKHMNKKYGLILFFKIKTTYSFLNNI